MVILSYLAISLYMAFENIDFDHQTILYSCNIKKIRIFLILLVYYGQFYNNLEEKNLFFLNNAVTGAIMVILGILGNSLYKAFENIEFDHKTILYSYNIKKIRIFLILLVYYGQF